MGTLHTMGRGVKHMDLGLGVLGFGLNAGVEFCSGAGVGFLYGKYRTTAWGQHTPKIAAAVGKTAAVLTQVFGGGSLGGRLVSGAFDSLGSAGLAILGCELGLSHGRKAAGMQAVLLPAGDKAPANALPISRIGQLALAPDGGGLTMRELNELAAMH